MFTKRPFRNKKGNWIIPLTAFYLLFNVALFVILLLFSTDPSMTGEIESTGTSQLNDSLEEGSMSYSIFSGLSGIEDYQVEVNANGGIPWWFKTLFFGFEGLILLIIIFGWIRGV